MLENTDFFKGGRVDQNALVGYIKAIKKNTKLSDEDAAVMAASKVVDAQPKSRIWYRIGATRNMTGGRKIQPTMKMTDKLKEVYDAINDNAELPDIEYSDSDKPKSIVEFHACKYIRYAFQIQKNKIQPFESFKHFKLSNCWLSTVIMFETLNKIRIRPPNLCFYFYCEK